MYLDKINWRLRAKNILFKLQYTIVLVHLICTPIKLIGDFARKIRRWWPRWSG